MSASCARTKTVYVYPEDCAPLIEENTQLRLEYENLLDRYEILMEDCLE